MSFGVHKALRGSRLETGISNFGPSLAVQSDKDRTDIRTIVARSLRGKSVVVNVREGFYADISNAPSYMEALGVVAQANALFASLPSAVRDRFANDPQRMLAFMDDDANKDESIRLGLRPKEAVPPPPPEPLLVRVVPDDPTK